MAEWSYHCRWYSRIMLKQKGTRREQAKGRTIWEEVVEDRVFYHYLGLFHLQWCALTLHSNVAFHEARGMIREKYVLGKVSVATWLSKGWRWIEW